MNFVTFVVKKFLCLPISEQRFLLKVMLLVWVVRVMLWVLPFRTVRKVLTKFSQKPASELAAGEGSLRRIAWAVTVASRYVLAATCLTQALVTKILLGRCGHHAIVRIGVERSAGGEFQAHAWVESCGEIVIGGSESSLQRYTPLAAANGELW